VVAERRMIYGRKIDGNAVSEGRREYSVVGLLSRGSGERCRVEIRELVAPRGSDYALVCLRCQLPHARDKQVLQTHFSLLGFVYAKARTLHRSHHFLTYQRCGCAQCLAMY
jgi:hypothetical protein